MIVKIDHNPQRFIHPATSQTSGLNTDVLKIICTLEVINSGTIFDFIEDYILCKNIYFDRKGYFCGLTNGSSDFLITMTHSPWIRESIW